MKDTIVISVSALRGIFVMLLVLIALILARATGEEVTPHGA